MPGDLLVSYFSSGARDSSPQLSGLSWAALAEWLLPAPEESSGRDKLTLPAWSPAWYPPDTARSKSAVVGVSCLVLDYDSGEPIERAVSLWGRWVGLWHTSWSHTPSAPRYRVVLPLAEPVEAGEWDRAWAWAANYAGRTIDPACKDPSRLYFCPARQAGGEYRSGLLGSLRRLTIPWQTVERPKPPPRQPWTPPRAESPGEAARAQREALRHPDVRRDLGLRLGGRESSGRISGIACPACSRRSVWWLIEPERKHSAECNHRNSCGWAAPLWDLAQGGGL